VSDDTRRQPPPTSNDGTDRRNPAVKDRRAIKRGGRRAGDMLKEVATFVHQLLTEPPR
jgi:hypothetical protein